MCGTKKALVGFQLFNINRNKVNEKFPFIYWLYDKCEDKVLRFKFEGSDSQEPYEQPKSEWGE